jgi:hypothetical protein
VLSDGDAQLSVRGCGLARGLQESAVAISGLCSTVAREHHSAAAESSQSLSSIAVCTRREFQMTSLPQTRPRNLPAQDSRRRTLRDPAGTPEAAGPARGRARQALPAVDPSTAFGCVDWFLYPDQAAGRSSAETQSKRAQA